MAEPLDVEQMLAAFDLEPAPDLESSYVATCNGGPWHGQEVEAVTGKIVVLHDRAPEVKGFYVLRYRIWIWEGWH